MFRHSRLAKFTFGMSSRSGSCSFATHMDDGADDV